MENGDNSGKCSSMRNCTMNVLIPYFRCLLACLFSVGKKVWMRINTFTEMYLMLRLNLHKNICISDSGFIEKQQTALLRCEDYHIHSYFFLYLSQWNFVRIEYTPFIFITDLYPFNIQRAKGYTNRLIVMVQ